MTGRRRSILVLTSTFPRELGDATPGFIADLALRLTEQFDVTVLAPAVPGAAGDEQWGSLRVRRFRYGWPASTQRLADGAILPNLRRHRLLWAQVPVFLLAELIAAWRLARRERFDAVHAHWVLPQGVMATLLKARFGIPMLVTSHGADLYALRQPPLAGVKRWVLQHADALTAVSSSLQEKMLRLGAPPERVSIVPMGVDTSAFSPGAAEPAVRSRLNPDGPALLFVGRLAEKKGAQYAVQAVSALLPHYPTVRLTLAGDGPERSDLEALVARLKLGSHVSFLGAVPHAQLPALYASADITLAPSVHGTDGDTEAFGLVIAEAMASGCAVVASDVGGIRDLVEHERTGLLVPERDPRAIAEAVARLLSNPDLRQGLRAHALQHAATVDSRSIANRYADLLQAVVS